MTPVRRELKEGNGIKERIIVMEGKLNRKEKAVRNLKRKEKRR